MAQGREISEATIQPKLLKLPTRVQSRRFVRRMKFLLPVHVVLLCQGESKERISPLELEKTDVKEWPVLL